MINKLWVGRALQWIGGLGIGWACWVTLHPFVTALEWGVIIAIACERARARIEQRVHHRNFAAFIVVSTLALAVVLPLIFASIQAASQVSVAYEWVKSLRDQELSQLPESIQKIPMIGPWVQDGWRVLSQHGMVLIAEVSKVHATQVATMLGNMVGHIGGMILDAGMALVIAGLCMARSKEWGGDIQEHTHRWFGAPGLIWLDLITACIRAVAMGVCATALLVSVMVWMGLEFAGIETSSLLACVCMVLCLIQIGPLPIVLPVCAGLVLHDQYHSAIALGFLWVPLSILDGMLRPYLISREIKMPMILIFVGVVGGVIMWGLLGLFAGPLSLAMGRKLWRDWHDSEHRPP